MSGRAAVGDEKIAGDRDPAGGRRDARADVAVQVAVVPAPRQADRTSCAAASPGPATASGARSASAPWAWAADSRRRSRSRRESASPHLRAARRAIGNRTEIKARSVPCTSSGARHVQALRAAAAPRSVPVCVSPGALAPRLEDGAADRVRRRPSPRPSCPGSRPRRRRRMPDSGMAWLGSRATATRMRSRLPMMALVGSNSTHPAPGRYTWHQAWVEPPPTCCGAIAARHVEVARHEAGGEAERAQRLDHEQREVAAAAAPEPQRLGRRRACPAPCGARR